MPRTTGAIALQPTGNLQGGYRFLNLNTGKIIARQHFTPIPMTEKVIARVHALASRDGFTKPMRMDIVNLEDSDSEEEEEDQEEIKEEQEEPQALDLEKMADFQPEGTEIIVEEELVSEEYYPSAGVSPEVIDLTRETRDVYQPLPPSPTEIKVEEEEIVFKEEKAVQDKKDVLFSNPPGSPAGEGYRTKSGRRVIPVSQYIPTLDSKKKYDEQAHLQLEKPGEPLRTP